MIHGAVMGQDLQTTADLVAQTTRSCLALADELGAESLALPAFGTGVGGFPLEEAPRSWSARRADTSPPRSERVVFAVYGRQAESDLRRSALEAA